MILLVFIFLKALSTSITGTPIRVSAVFRNQKFHLRDHNHNQYLKVQLGSMFLSLVDKSEHEEDQNLSEKSKMSEITLFTGCNNFNDFNIDEICIAGNEEKRLFYDHKHDIFLFFEPNYKTEIHHICRISTFVNQFQEYIAHATIKCGPNKILQTARSHNIRSRNSTGTFYRIENLEEPYHALI